MTSQRSRKLVQFRPKSKSVKFTVLPVFCMVLMFSLFVFSNSAAQTADECAVSKWYDVFVEEFEGSKSAKELESLVQYGVVRLYGLDGVEASGEEAVLSFRKAALSGYPPAQNILGALYLTGWGPNQSSNDLAKTYFEMAAKQNYAPAQKQSCYDVLERLGSYRKPRGSIKISRTRFSRRLCAGTVQCSFVLRNSRSGKQNYPDIAVKWLEAADQSDYAPASFKLGVDAAKGLGVEKDYGKAAQSFVKAAKAGDPWSQYNLGRMHALGLGVPQNLVDAYAWFLSVGTRGGRGCRIRSRCYNADIERRTNSGGS